MSAADPRAGQGAPRGTPPTPSAPSTPAQPADFKAAYRTVRREFFPETLEMRFGEGAEGQVLRYRKVTWTIGGERKGLRYGDNPDQEAALYRLEAGSLALGEVTTIQPGRYLVSDAELLQSGKHPGKTNLTDIDSALNILRYLPESPCTVIVKHNNPCGAAKGPTLAESYRRAYLADRIAAFGGAIAVNRELDRETAELIAEQYCEVVAAPGFADGVLDVLGRRKNLRVMRIADLDRLAAFADVRVPDFTSLVDGGLVLQWSFSPITRRVEDFLPAAATHQGREYRVRRAPTPEEADDLLFGWLVEAGVTSNSVIYVRDGATVGIGTGEQDRVGVAEIARDKACRKLADRLAWERHRRPYSDLPAGRERAAIDEEVRERRGGLRGSRMVSDAFFPFRDGVDVGLREGITAVIQPGGSERDHEVIEACNEADAAMVFTGQRSFRH
jgi:phosphoribosylaminoimidazolecarboxamide formyltransferase/IMP cyclohydrolase